VPSSNRRVAVLGIVVSFALLLIASGNASARAPVACGDVIKADTKLTHDLVNCPSNGLKIGADHVTLDLNGHSIEGNGKPVPSCHAACDLGIFMAHKRDVEIRGGTVKNFNVGVVAFRASHGVIDRISAKQNRFIGLVISVSGFVRIFRSEATHNGLHTDNSGIGVFGSHRIRVSHSSSSRNGDIGMYVQDTVNSHFADNVLAYNPEAGLNLSGNHNSIARNHVARTGDGVIVSGNRNRVAKNRIEESKGCHPGCGVGISVEDGHGNLVSANSVGRAHNVGIRIKSFTRKQHLRFAEVKGNRVTNSGRHGILIGKRIRDADVRANGVLHNEKDGIRVESPGTRVGYNYAIRNGDLGINAVPGVVDARRNVAHDNGDPRQCVNVLCSPTFFR
jgi:hypothetical protein